MQYLQSSDKAKSNVFLFLFTLNTLIRMNLASFYVNMWNTISGSCWTCPQGRLGETQYICPKLPHCFEQTFNFETNWTNSKGPHRWRKGKQLPIKSVLSLPSKSISLCTGTFFCDGKRQCWSCYKIVPRVKSDVLVWEVPSCQEGMCGASN